MTEKELYYLLEQGGNLIYKSIENRYKFYAQFDKEISKWLSTMYHFGGYGEFHEMVELFEQRLFN